MPFPDASKQDFRRCTRNLIVRRKAKRFLRLEVVLEQVQAVIRIRGREGLKYLIG